MAKFSLVQSMIIKTNIVVFKGGSNDGVVGLVSLDKNIGGV